ncbi:hypothetical protein D5H75_30135 [Bailinhaonella thermotolerans]|uniref:Tetratricopeptide repeat protein n=1 Tax=Bailinhaonella thermotolerans TaxID=1070861 RepID=A0A3A4A5I7_9ACTN|nr:hypothetical protein D5H75_30135 [Bailinhaonella thermotolerans]
MTYEYIDRLLGQALLLGDHGTLARRLTELIDDYSSGDVPRATVMVMAAEEWRQAGQPARALELFRRAIDDGGDAGIDPRCGIADTLFELDRPGEAREIIAAVRAEGRVDPQSALYLAETLAAYGDLEAAHEWATEGVRLGPDDPGLRDALLRTRYRIRVDLGLGEDTIDAMLDS